MPGRGAFCTARRTQISSPVRAPYRQWGAPTATSPGIASTCSYPASCSSPRGPAVGHQPRTTRCVSCHGRSAAAKSGGLLPRSV